MARSQGGLFVLCIIRIVIDLITLLEEKIKKLDLQIADVKFERDHSATPMESASDKSRQLAEQLMDALSDEKKVLLLLKRNSKKITDITIYSVDTPLGKGILLSSRTD